MLVALIAIALAILIHYQVIGLVLLGIIVWGVVHQEQKIMFFNLASFLIAAIFVIGIPLGIIQQIYPETNVPTAQIVEEVLKQWIG